MADTIPVVDSFILDPAPHLVASECTACGARFFDRRNACARCSGLEFARVELPSEGSVISFTIVAFAGPGVEVPFVAAQIDCAGTQVNANIINLPARPENVELGMRVRLATYSMGTDTAGVEAIGFGFEPIN